jgi:hypothetical protein
MVLLRRPVIIRKPQALGWEMPNAEIDDHRTTVTPHHQHSSTSHSRANPRRKIHIIRICSMDVPHIHMPQAADHPPRLSIPNVSI